MTDDDESNEVIIPPQGRVSAEAEAELWKLADQVVSVLQLAGIPAQVMKDGQISGGAVITVDCSLSGHGVSVDWRGSDALYEAGWQARQRMDLQDPAHLWYAKLITDVMPETLVQVLETAGMRVIVDDLTIHVEGPVPDYLLTLIED